jgi:hypothetical protein
MRSDLELAILEWGGKNGVLSFLKEKVPGLRHSIVPLLLFRMHDKITSKMRGACEFACEFFGTNNIVGRSSARDDINALVDTTPTEVGILENLDDLVRSVRDQCRNPLIAAYSRQEGGRYDPEEVTLSISPLLTIDEQIVLRGLITEHPNLPGVSCVDLKYGGVDHCSYGNSFSFDFLKGRALPVGMDFSSGPNVNIEQLENDAREGLVLSERVRASGVFPRDKALQFEFAKWKKRNGSGAPELLGEVIEGDFLTQVKFFADKIPSSCSADEIEAVFNAENSKGFRNFGITSRDGLVLPCVTGENRSVFRKFEKDHPGVPYAAHLSLEGLTQPLTLHDCLPRMMAHLPVPKASIDHKQSRPAMHCLANGGVAFLNNPHNIECDGASRVRVKSDGLHPHVEPIA